MPQHRAFGVHPKVSLQGIIHEGRSLEEGISQVKNSRVFLCALAEEKSSHGRSSIAMSRGELWDSLRKGFDFVLIDSPPIALSEETLALVPHADGMILVIQAEKTRSQVASNLKERVTKTGGKVLGCVFNKQRHYIPEWIYRRL
jgi:Mrp family chromosome partitioning ATPase